MVRMVTLFVVMTPPETNGERCRIQSQADEIEVIAMAKMIALYGVTTVPKTDGVKYRILSQGDEQEMTAIAIVIVKAVVVVVVKVVVVVVVVMKALRSAEMTVQMKDNVAHRTLSLTDEQEMTTIVKTVRKTDAVRCRILFQTDDHKLRVTAIAKSLLCVSVTMKIVIYPEMVEKNWTNPLGETTISHPQGQTKSQVEATALKSDANRADASDPMKLKIKRISGIEMVEMRDNPTKDPISERMRPSRGEAHGRRGTMRRETQETRPALRGKEVNIADASTAAHQTRESDVNKLGRGAEP